MSIPLQIVYLAPRNQGTKHPHHNLKFTYPPDVMQRKFPRPVVHDNGDIEYPRLADSTDQPDDIEGYARDANNTLLFHPVWPTCMRRFVGFQLKDDGSVDIKAHCQNPEAVQYTGFITCLDCQACPVQVKG